MVKKMISKIYTSLTFILGATFGFASSCGVLIYLSGGGINLKLAIGAGICLIAVVVNHFTEKKVSALEAEVEEKGERLELILFTKEVLNRYNATPCEWDHLNAILGIDSK